MELRTHPSGVVYLAFRHIQAPHAFSTRLGGVSRDPYHWMNLGWKSGDDPERVRENQARFEAAVGFATPPTLEMVHGAEVAIVREPVQERLSGDACVTAVAGVGMSLTTADCVPIFYHDPVRNVVALAHAGWRGTLTGVSVTTLEAMIGRFGTAPPDVRVGIGPAIGPCCFEVDRDVAEQFEERFPEEDLVLPGGATDKFRIDLWRANESLLRQAGVLPARIATGGFCTVCRSDLFFSYRRDRGKTGRMLACITPAPASEQGLGELLTR
ncbi:MAG: peptidoglycan editing factor PgeF [Candidatus Eremiobacterota bacterium]